jgi:hypothetical protein
MLNYSHFSVSFSVSGRLVPMVLILTMHVTVERRRKHTYARSTDPTTLTLTSRELVSFVSPTLVNPEG